MSREDEPCFTGVAFDIGLTGGAGGGTTLACVQNLVLPSSSSTGLLALAVLKEEAGFTLGAARGQRSTGDDRTGLTVGATGMALLLVEEFSSRLTSGAAGELIGRTIDAVAVTLLAQIVLQGVALGTSFASVRRLTARAVVQVAFHAVSLGTAVGQDFLVA